MGIGLFETKRLIGFSIKKYFFQVLIPTGVTAIITVFVTILIFETISDGWLKLVASTSTSAVLIIILTYSVIMSQSERKRFVQLAKAKMLKLQ